MSDSYTVTPDILSNMGSLEKLLSERGFTTATVPVQGDPGSDQVRVVRNEVGAGEVDVRDPELYATPGVVQQQPQPGVAPQQVVPDQPGGQPSALQQQQPAQQQVSVQQYQAAMAYAARMQAQAEAAAQAAQEAEDDKFLADIAHLPQAEQDREILIRYNRQLEERLEQTEGRAQQIQETVQQREQREAKEDVAWQLAMVNGLHWENPAVQKWLMSANTRQEMDETVAYLRSLTPAQQAQVARTQPVQTPTQVAGQIVAARGRGNTTRQAPGVRKHSGDLAGYLKGRGYQVVHQD